MTLIYYLGQEYTLKELSIMLGIKYNTLAKRKERGWTDVELIEGKNVRNGQPVTIYGKTYGSLNQAAVQLHMSCYDIRKILDNQPCLYPIIDHKQYKSYQEAMKDLGLNFNEVKSMSHFEDEYSIKIYNKEDSSYYYFKNKEEMMNYYNVDNIEDIGEFIKYGNSL